jgi:hypothetical protein
VPKDFKHKATRKTYQQTLKKIQHETADPNFAMSSDLLAAASAEAYHEPQLPSFQFPHMFFYFLLI